MWIRKLLAAWTSASPKKPGRRTAARRRFGLYGEDLETRVALAADLQMYLVDSLAVYATPGQSIQVRTKVVNVGNAASGNYTLSWYLSADKTITTADRLLGSATRSALAAGVKTTWLQNVTLPANAIHSRYYLGAIISTADANPKNNVRADAGQTAVLYTSLTGSAAYNGAARSVAIRPSAGSSSPIFDDVPTWIVIHGRNSSPASPNLVQLAAALDGYASSDQVLVLDWSAAAESGLLGGAGENYIKPVAAWASAALAGYGLEPRELNLAGHSWGTYVAAELAELQPAAAGWPAGQVNSILAVDPAVDYPLGYDPTAANEVNFARNSRFSWTFHAYGGLFGSATTAATADEAFTVTGSDHSGAVNVVADLVRMAYAPATAGAAQIGAQFRLERLLTAALNPAWIPNSYTNAGARSSGGPFEAVVAAASGGLRVKSLTYFDGAAEVVVNV